jgi:hypothetical protein
MMNRRIQELIKQATSIQGPTPYNPLTFEVFDKEKFAELIIRECANIVESSSLPDAYSEACLLNIADEIKEHFGLDK